MKALLEKTYAYRMFKNDFFSGALSHAYLVVCPDEKNLRQVLKEFTVLLFTDERKKKLVYSESFSDVKIYPASGKKLTADIAGEIIYESGMKPVEGDKKIFVIDGFNNAGAVVQNKLLKILEEPPSGVIFILGAVNTFSVLPTVLSRVRRLEIPPFSEQEIKEYLVRHYPDKKNYAGCAAAAGGIVGRAENLLSGGDYDNLISLAKRSVFVVESEIPQLNREVSDIEEKQEYLALVRLVLRDILVSSAGGKPELLTDEECADGAFRYSETAALKCCEFITEAERQLKLFSFFPRIVEEMLIRFVSETEK